MKKLLLIMCLCFWGCCPGIRTATDHLERDINEIDCVLEKGVSVENAALFVEPLTGIRDSLLVLRNKARGTRYGEMGKERGESYCQEVDERINKVDRMLLFCKGEETTNDIDRYKIETVISRLGIKAKKVK